MDTSEDTYVSSVKSTINEINKISIDIENVNLDNSSDKLITAYQKIVKIAQKASSLQPPAAMKEFDVQFKDYMEKTTNGYYLLIEGTKNKDLDMIKKGIKILSELDDSFLKQLKSDKTTN